MYALLHPTYCPTIAHIAAIKKYGVKFEVSDFYEKQTYRNRTYIYGSKGKQMLVVPIIHTPGQEKQRLKEIRIDNSANWNRQHWKTLETSYRSSAYFEYYESKLLPIFFKKYVFLVNLNLEIIELVCALLKINLDNKVFTDLYEHSPDNSIDFRSFSNAKKPNKVFFEPYYQLFSTQKGFLENLSVLDLIFNEGPNSEIYLNRLNFDV